MLQQRHAHSDGHEWSWKHSLSIKSLLQSCHIKPLLWKALHVTLQWFCQMVERLMEWCADYSLPQGTVEQAEERACLAKKQKTPLSSAIWWGWRPCSLVQIGACNSQQNLRLLLISFMLVLTGLTLWRPLRLPPRPKTGTFWPKHFRGCYNYWVFLRV